MAINWGGAGGGALNGAALGSSFGPVGTAIGAGAGGLLGAFTKKKKSIQPYTPQPYSGMRPPRIDYTDPTGAAGGWLSQSFPSSLQELVKGKSGNEVNSLRPVQTLYTGLVANRAQGNDVGYSPEWMKSSQALINSELNKAQEDRLRDTRGSLSAQGLSGNPRAYEATAGRVQRDTQRELQDAMSKLTIADMERKNQERDVNTGRLGVLNTTNFGQENKAADFDRAIWEAEQANNAGAQGINLANRLYDTSQDDSNYGGAGGLLGDIDLSSLFSPSSQALTQGKGVAPGTVLSADELTRQNRLNSRNPKSLRF